MKKRILALALSFCMALSLMPTTALAADHVHDDTCGYAAPVPCGHTSHDDICGYAEAVTGAACTHSCTDGTCSFVAADDGTPCNHTCDFDVCGYSPEIPGTPCNKGCSETVDGEIRHNNCDYSEGEPESPCTHSHDEACGYKAPVTGVACDHEHDTNCGYAAAVEAQPCMHENNVHDDSCGYFEGSDCNYVSEAHEHSYSNATCTTPATCSCGATMGEVDSANHAETYWVKYDYHHREYCVACDTPLTDFESHVYDNNDDMICNICEYMKASHGDAHIWSESWHSNATHHWHHCTADGRCDLEAIGSRNGYATHSFTDKAVAIDGNVHGRKCTVCNRTLEQVSHNFDVVGAEGAEGADGHRIRCSECGGSKLEAHVFVDDSDAICDTCGYVRNIAHTHAYTTWKPSEYNPEAYHVLCCSVCGEMSNPVQGGEHNYEVKNDTEGHWNLCADCGYTTAETAHIFSNDADTNCDTCGYTRVIIPVLTIITESMTGATVGKAYSQAFTYTGDASGVVFWNATGLPGGLTIDVSTGTVSGTPTTAGTYEVTIAMGATGSGSASKTYTLVVEAANTHDYKETYDNTGHWTECDCGEKTAVQPHSYTGMLDTTCDCGYNRGLLVTNDDGKDFFEVGFIPGSGVTLPDDAELVVGEHYPSLAPIAGTLVPTAETEYVDISDVARKRQSMSRTSPDGVTYDGFTFIVIDDVEYFFCDDAYTLINTNDGSAYSLEFGIDGEPVLNKNPGELKRYEKTENKKLSLNGATYDVVAMVNEPGVAEDEFETNHFTYYVLYHNGKPAGEYFPNQDAARFVEGYEPETRKALQYDNVTGTVSGLGTFTIPADYNNAAIVDLAPGKTYNVSVVDSHDISVRGYDEALLDYAESYTDTGPDTSAEYLNRLVDDMLAKGEVLEGLRSGAIWEMLRRGFAEAEADYRETRDELFDLVDIPSATVSQTYKIPDALAGVTGVTYVAVHDTNPYADDLAAVKQAMDSAFNEWAVNDSESALAEYERLNDVLSEIKISYGAWEEENGSDAEYGTVTVSDDGSTLTATYTGVTSLSPFIVYAFVEADEPEYKVITTNTESADGEDDVPGGPATGDDTPATPAYTTYTVQRGDTLWAIARKYGCTVSGLVAANSGLIKDPNLLYAGWQLKIPQAGATGSTPDAILPDDKKTTVYIVKQGDTLWAISRKYGCIVAEIVALNGELIDEPDLIFAGWELKIPQD